VELEVWVGKEELEFILDLVQQDNQALDMVMVVAVAAAPWAAQVVQVLY
jgi:hypothetical protein